MHLLDALSETTLDAAGHTTLAYVRAGDTQKPLVVFAPGGAYLARVAYGAPGTRPDDFLAHWLQRAGFAFLALSYPSSNAAFARSDPAFSVTDWAEQIAAATAHMVEAEKLPNRVIVLASSMAGRLVTLLRPRFESRGLDLELFVALAATPALPGLLPGIETVFAPTPDGFVNRESTIAANLRAVAEQEEIEGCEIVSPSLFEELFLTDWPVGLGGGALRSDQGRFLADLAADLEDTRPWDWDALPPIACICGRSTTDPRHALVDRATWGFLIAQELSRRILEPRGRAGLDDAVTGERWAELRRLVDRAPRQLTVSLPGGHLFFLGRRSARAAAETIDLLYRRSRLVRVELTALLERNI